MFSKICSVSVLVLVVFLVLLTACAKATPTPAPTVPAPAPTAPAPAPTAPTPTLASGGQSLYAQKCAACHGPNAEGTAAGPAIAGHSIAVTKTQVRNPMGTMPAFPSSQLSDHDLDEIAEFIAGLGRAEAAVKEWEKAATETMHAWMALLAIKSNDPEDARHHLQDILTFVKETKNKDQIDRTLGLIAQGNLHDAEHEIEEIAGSESPSGVTAQRFHLLLTQRSVEDKDVTRVKHHLDHFLVKATEGERAIAQEALDLVERGDFHEAEHEIEELFQGQL